jgi:CheY-like chemotaxis protein
MAARSDNSSVLVVDAKPSMARRICMGLELGGARTVTALSAGEAVSVWKKQPVSALVMNRQTDQLEALKALAEHYGVPYLIFRDNPFDGETEPEVILDLFGLLLTSAANRYVH